MTKKANQPVVWTKLLLETRAKGKDFANKTFYPLYIRVNCKNKGTFIRFKNQGMDIFLTKNGFEYPGPDLTATIIQKKILIEKAVRYCLEKNVDFDPKDFTNRFKLWEKGIFKLLRDRFIELAKQKAMEQVDNLNEYNQLNFDLLLVNDHAWIKFASMVHQHDELAQIGRCLVAYHFFIKRIKYDLTVWDWLHEDKWLEFASPKDYFRIDYDCLNEGFALRFAPIDGRWTEYRMTIDKIIAGEMEE